MTWEPPYAILYIMQREYDGGFGRRLGTKYCSKHSAESFVTCPLAGQLNPYERSYNLIPQQLVNTTCSTKAYEGYNYMIYSYIFYISL